MTERPSAETAWHGVLVRFGEIGIKSAYVRRAMLERLRQNLLDGMLREGLTGDVKSLGSRLWMVGPRADALADLACRTFGVVSASPARLVLAEMEALKREAAAIALTRPWASFAVRASREGKHPFTSQDVAVQAGSAVYVAAQAAGRSPRVDLGSPEMEVWIDIRQAQAFVFLDRLAGPGGLPLGSQGRVVALLSDEASFVAAWLMMRRGCHVVPLHAGDTGSVPADAVAALARWGLPRDVEVLPVCTGTVRKEELLAAAAEVARSRKAAALVTGDTLDSRLVAPPGMAVLRPVCGLDAGEYARIRDRIGLPAIEARRVLDSAGRDTAESMLRLRRVVTV